MNIFVILGHPREGSFNHAIARVAIQTLRGNGHEVIFHDLYREGFDPILPSLEVAKDAALDAAIERHCDEISRAEGIIVVHPNWWGQPPAILKGWIDRVLRPGVAYEFREGDCGDGIPVGLLRAKTALVFNTSDTPRERELEVFGDPLETLWGSCIFDLCGVRSFHREVYGVIVTSTSGERKAWLEDVGEVVDRYFPKSGRRAKRARASETPPPVSRDRRRRI
jgi:putative NADPH-quinone reductase